MQKQIKKILFFVLLLLMIFNVGVASKAYTLVDLGSTKGGSVTYRGSSTVVQIPDQYEAEKTDFRAAWVSLFVADMSSYSNESNWKKEVKSVIDVFKYYNLNTMIFHVRTHNNALYKSKLNPVAKWFENADFDTFDPLTYLIDECHKAGIEFHAWMNPYRISTLTTDINEAMENGQYLSSKVPSANPARFAGNLINGSSGVILNPGLPKVRDFIVDTCMEVIENYDVDAIHFDDYFYISGTNDSDTYAKYNPKGLGKADWRREQVNLFIEQLHDAMTEYNQKNNKAVQLGISPSGIYKNGNGSVSSGSNTAGFAHYGDYLYSDTYKWAKEGWIDYLLPQSYWAFEHPSAGYADVMSWWNKAFEGLDCLLYSGIGLYMADGNNYSWKTNKQEFANQLKYLMTLENVSGYSIYSFKYVRAAYKGGMDNSAQQVRNAEKAGCFSNVVLYPEIKNMDPMNVGKVEDLKLTDNVLTWKHNPDVKAYAVYASTSEVTFQESEIIALVGSITDVVEYKSTLGEGYNYGVRAISKTNTLGEGVKAIKQAEEYTVTFVDDEGNVLSEQKVVKGSAATAPSDPKKEGYIFIGWDQKFDNITSDLTVKALFEKTEDVPNLPTEPTDPAEPDPGKGCKQNLVLAVVSIISLSTLGVLILRKEK